MAQIGNIYTDANGTEYTKHPVARVSKVKDDAHLYDLVDTANAIDQGANLVLGHDPHVLQGIDIYKGCYIVYSLGNFCFGGNTNPADKDTMIFQQTFTFKDDKLKKDLNARVIPCSISSVSYQNDYRPTVLKGDSKKRVIDRLNSYSSSMKVHVTSKGKLKKK